MVGPGTLAGGMIAIYYVGTGSDSGNNGVTGNAGGEVSSASPLVYSLRLSCQTLLFLIQGRNTLARVYNTAYIQQQEFGLSISTEFYFV